MRRKVRRCYSDGGSDVDGGRLRPLEHPRPRCHLNYHGGDWMSGESAVLKQ